MSYKMSGSYGLPNKDFYEILGCTPSSTQEELKEAYRRKVLESHPDKSTNANETIETFREVKKAWETLKDPELREQYDYQSRQATLEAEIALIHARIKLSELEETEEEDIFSYPCRCGNNYLVHKTDLEEINCVIHVPCQDCTFVVAIET